jgi:UDP-2,3-diacylglucosamine pyrophosphatase LpxH
VIVSDLHMAAPGGPFPDPFGEDDVFAALLAALARDGAPARLVLLGDTFDLVLAAGALDGPRRRDPVAAAVSALDAIAEAHPRVLASLAAFAAAGHEVDLVPGNHDIELLRPAVQQRLRQLVARCGADRALRIDRVAFPPWVVHVPGVLYAEHGQQHHDLNHFRRLLARTATAGHRPVSRPLALCLDEGRVELARRRVPVGKRADVALHAAALAAQLARAGGGFALGDGRRARVEHERIVHAHATELGLPVSALLQIQRAATPTPASLARRLAAGGDFMLPAAHRVVEALAEAGAGTAFCVFGHTHRADDRPLSKCADAPRYLNAGTWSTLVRPGASGSEDRLRYINIEYGDGRPPSAHLRRAGAAEHMGRVVNARG